MLDLCYLGKSQIRKTKKKKKKKKSQISQIIRVTFATIFHNSDKSLITFVLFRVISPIPIHVYFSAICTNSSKKLDRFCAILSNSK